MRSRPGVETRLGRKRSGRRPERSSGFRWDASTTNGIKRRLRCLPAPLPDLALPERVTFVIGAEREGLPEDMAADCELQATIPLEPAAESLNAAVSAAIALYERRRRTR